MPYPRPYQAGNRRAGEKEHSTEEKGFVAFEVPKLLPSDGCITYSAIAASTPQIDKKVLAQEPNIIHEKAKVVPNSFPLCKANNGSTRAQTHNFVLKQSSPFPRYEFTDSSTRKTMGKLTLKPKVARS